MFHTLALGRFLAGVGLLVLVGSVLAGELVAQDAQIGAVRYKSPLIAINDVRGAEFSKGTVIVVGNNGNLGVSQNFKIASGQVEAVKSYWSQEVALNGGPEPISGSFIFDVNVLVDGRMVVHGSSHNGVVNSSPTYWSDRTQPVGVAPSAGDTGIVDFVTPSGVLGGFLNNPASVGSLTTKMKNLPGASGGSAVIAASPDDQYLVGLGIWKQVQPGTLDYALIDTSQWDKAPGMNGVPEVFKGIVQIGTRYLVAAEYLELDTFTTQVGVWDVESGKLVGETATEDSFADFRVIEGRAVLGVNSGDDGGAVYILPTTGPGLGSRLDLSAKLATTDDVIIPHTIYTDELGMVVRAGGTIHAVSLEFDSSPPQTRVQLQTSMRTIGLGKNAYYGGWGLIEVEIDGSSAVDLSQTDWRTIQLTSDAGIGAVRPLIGLVLSRNADSYSDVLVYYWMPQIRQAGVINAPNNGQTITPQLMVSGSTKLGVEFFGIQTLTLDSQPYWQRRFQELFKF